MRRQSGIYRIWNVVTDKCYVGSAKSVLDRGAIHLSMLRAGCHDNPRLQNSFNKHGLWAFHFGVLEFCEVADLIRREQLWINYFQSSDDRHGYNICPVAGSVLGLRFKSPRTSAYFKGRPKPMSQRRKQASSMTDYWSSEEVHQKMSDVHSSRSAEAEASIQAGRDRYWKSPDGQEHLAKLKASDRSAGQAKYWASPRGQEHLEKLRQANERRRRPKS